MSTHDLRHSGSDAKLIEAMPNHGVKGIDRLQAMADFGQQWAFRVHLDGRYCGVRELTIMGSDDPAERMLMVLGALRRLHEDHCVPEDSGLGIGKL